jgi:peptidoglycan/LPS O-acetylase OafA/YrhL
MENRPSRQLWLAAIVVSVICVAALAWGVINYWDEPADKTLDRRPAESRGGFGVGLLVGLGAGIVVGSLLAARKRPS